MQQAESPGKQGSPHMDGESKRLAALRHVTLAICVCVCVQMRGNGRLSKMQKPNNNYCWRCIVCIGVAGSDRIYYIHMILRRRGRSEDVGR